MNDNKEMLLRRIAEMTDAQVRVAFLEMITMESSVQGEVAEKTLSKIFAWVGGRGNTSGDGSTSGTSG